MVAFRPKYITFDCYGTLINFQMSLMTRAMFADRLAPDNLQGFTTDFSAYPFPPGVRTLTSRPPLPQSRRDFHSSSCRSPLTVRSIATSKNSARHFMPFTQPSRRKPINPASRHLNT